jgi:hypothetical protein
MTGNPNHPLCGWSLTRDAQPINKSAEYRVRRWAFDVGRSNLLNCDRLG